jgi:hypothetical protein
VTVERVLTDNGSAYRSRPWTQACTELAITPKKHRNRRQTARHQVDQPPWAVELGSVFKSILPRAGLMPV